MDISIVTINYNTSHETLNCVKSILNTIPSAVSFEVVVVDNASELADYENLKANIPEGVKLYRSKVNSGFGGGNMFGFNFCSESEYTLFLNNDCLISSDVFSPILRFMSLKKDCGVVGIHGKNDKGEAIKARYQFNTLRKEFFPKAYNPPKLNCNDEFKYQLVDYVSGSFMFFRTQSFKEIGGFDVAIFLYYEEMDICFRLKHKLRQEVCYMDDLEYVHFVDKSGLKLRKNVLEKTKEIYLSHAYVYRKCYGAVYYRFFLFVKTLKLFIKFLLGKSDWTLFTLYLRGAHLSESKRYRQVVQK